MLSQDVQERPLLLAETVTRRICHDLAGLMGTLDGLIELAAEDPEAAGLAQETAQRLAARLRLVRGAWGGGLEEINPATLASLAQGLPGAERLHVACAGLAPLHGDAARLCACLLLAAAAGLPRGGTIHAAGTPTAFWMALEGQRAAWPAALTAAPPSVDPHAVPGVLCRLLAASIGWALEITETKLVAKENAESSVLKKKKQKDLYQPA